MIKTRVGNLLDVTSGHIVHGCNAKGVMGSGVALAVKNKYPAVFQDYVDIYEEVGLTLGDAYPVQVSKDLILWNAITQDGYGLPTRNCSYDAIQTCFEKINKVVIEYDAVEKEIHIPAIGAGLGGGRWHIIQAIIEDTVHVPVTLWVLP